MSCCAIEKGAPAAWLDGLKVEERGVRKLTPAFARGIRLLRAEIDEIIKLAESTPTLNIAAAFGGLPWGAFSEELTEAWEPASRRALEDAGRDAQEAVLSKGAEPRTVILKIADEEVRAIAAAWATEHALDLAEVTTLGSREGVERALVRAINQNRSIVDVAKDIRAMVGITSSDVDTLDRMRALMTEQGATESQIAKAVEKRAGRMRRWRAENIARTEMNTARNRGTLEVWKASVSQGELPGDTLKVWVANGACPICEAIMAAGPVPIRDAFQSARGPVQHPPAHPSCRCSMSLQFA